MKSVKGVGIVTRIPRAPGRTGRRLALLRMKPVKKIVCVALVTLLSVVVGCGDGGKTETRKPPARSGASNASTAAQAAPSASSAEVTLDPATAGTITQLAHPLHLPPLHHLFAVSRTPEGEAEEAAATEA